MRERLSQEISWRAGANFEFLAGNPLEGGEQTLENVENYLPVQLTHTPLFFVSV